jgi:hypothetical protein
MNASPQALTIPKAGHTDAENEDAAAFAIDDGPVHAAVADGATESAFSRTWARLLVERSVAEGIIAPTETALTAWRTAWRTAVDPKVQAQPWYVAAKTEQGAHATYLHLQCTANGDWQAARVGDCVLFHIRNRTLQATWPDMEADSFNHRPDLVSTQPSHTPTVHTTQGTWQPGDAFLLATDAAAAWLLQTGVAPALEWTPNAFRDAAQAARTQGTLRNDDTTVLRLVLSS